MTAQDADDSSTESAERDDDTAEPETDERTDQAPGQRSPESVEEMLSEIASAPDGNVDDALDDMLGEDDSGATSADTASDQQGRDPEMDIQVDSSEVTVPDEFVEELEATSTETIAEAILLLRADRKRLESELAGAHERADDFESRLKRKQADFQNYKKRQKERLEEEKQRATEDLVERLLDVRDNLERALDQDEDADIRGGVETTLDQFDQQLDRENVEQVQPAPGEETDPTRHEVLATVESDEPEGTIADVHRPGYEMAGKVIRPAQVTVSDGSGHETDEN